MEQTGVTDSPSKCVSLRQEPNVADVRQTTAKRTIVVTSSVTIKPAERLTPETINILPLIYDILGIGHITYHATDGPSYIVAENLIDQANQFMKTGTQQPVKIDLSVSMPAWQTRISDKNTLCVYETLGVDLIHCSIRNESYTCVASSVKDLYAGMESSTKTITPTALELPERDPSLLVRVLAGMFGWYFARINQEDVWVTKAC